MDSVRYGDKSKLLNTPRGGVRNPGEWTSGLERYLSESREQIINRISLFHKHNSASIGNLKESGFADFFIYDWLFEKSNTSEASVADIAYYEAGLHQFYLRKYYQDETSDSPLLLNILLQPNDENAIVITMPRAQVALGAADPEVSDCILNATSRDARAKFLVMYERVAAEIFEETEEPRAEYYLQQLLAKKVTEASSEEFACEDIPIRFGSVRLIRSSLATGYLGSGRVLALQPQLTPLPNRMTSANLTGL